MLIGIFAVLGFVGISCGLWFANSLNNRIHRTDPFDQVTGGRPAKEVSGAINFLLIGSDTREPGEDPGVVGDRSDSLSIAHVDRDHHKISVVSIPRDTWVYVPRDKHGNGGRYAKINAANSWGGLPLAISTVERFTGVHIDHVLRIDFAGFKKVVDTLGGVDVQVTKTVTDPRSKRTFHQGNNHLDGAAALDYVRQRYGLPRGDFDRIQRQHIFLRAVMTKATDTGTLTNPVKMKSFLEATASSITADRQFSLTDTAVQLRKIRADDFAFVTMPVSGTENKDGQSVVIADQSAANELFRAIARDTLPDWLHDHPAAAPVTGN